MFDRKAYNTCGRIQSRLEGLSRTLGNLEIISRRFTSETGDNKFQMQTYEADKLERTIRRTYREALASAGDDLQSVVEQVSARASEVESLIGIMEQIGASVDSIAKHNRVTGCMVSNDTEYAIAILRALLKEDLI